MVAFAQPMTSDFVYPVGGGEGKNGDYVGKYKIEQYYNNPSSDGYCSADPNNKTLIPSTCTAINGRWMFGHDGLDLNRGSGSEDCSDPVNASGIGTVVFAEPSGGWGNIVRIRHSTPEGVRYTLYAHLNRILVVNGQDVVLGQQIGTIGGTGGYPCHLHFGVLTADVNGPGYSFGNSMPDNLDPIAFITRYTSGTYAHPFDFTDDLNNAYICADQPVGNENTSWVYTCQNRQVSFQAGADVFSIIRLLNIRRNIRFRVEAWYGQDAWRSSIAFVDRPGYDWAWDEPAFRQVVPWVWNYTYFNPQFAKPKSGIWTFKVFTDTGAGFSFLTSLRFTVASPPQPPPAPPYQYGGSVHCKNGVTGGFSTNYIYTCNAPQSSYTQGDTVWAMFHINNVTVRHSFRARVLVDNQFINTVNMGWWNEVNPGEVWPYTYYWIPVSNAAPGNYEVRFDVQTDAGWSNDVGVSRFTVNPLPSFTYNASVPTSLCSTEPFGSESTNWIWRCASSATRIFSQGQDIRLFAFVENVRQSYKFRARFYRNGSSWFEREDETGMTTVPPGQVWSTAFAWPGLWGAPTGNWRATLEIYTASSGWVMLQDNITFSVLPSIGSYVKGAFTICRGDPEAEKNTSGVPQCLYREDTRSVLSPLRPYYWRLQFVGLPSTASVRYRIEAYHNGVYAWSWDFGPYTPMSNGESWFWPKFVNPGPGTWELLFFATAGAGPLQQVDSDTFFSL